MKREIHSGLKITTACLVSDSCESKQMITSVNGIGYTSSILTLFYRKFTGPNDLNVDCK